MRDSIQVIKLDLLTIKSYWRQIVLSYLFVSLAVMPGLPQSVNVIYFVLTSAFLMYPFMVAQQNGLNKLYSIIAIQPKTIVRAKYLSALGGMSITILLLGPTNLFINKVMKVPISLCMTIGIILLGITLYCLVVAIQLPYCFKYGYAKAKVITMILPIGIGFGIPGIAFIATRVLGKEVTLEFLESGIGFVADHYVGIGAGCLLLSALVMLLSYGISLRIHIT
ncbi:MAG: ABC-2 transporter permease [Clostridium sp.]